MSKPNNSGIKSVSSNMQQNQQLKISSGVFMAFFGPALIEYYSNKNKKRLAKGEGSNVPAISDNK